VTASEVASSGRGVATSGATTSGPPPRRGRATIGNVVVSEWTKLRTLRSTFWAFLIAALLAIGLGALISFLSARHYASDPTVHLDWSPTNRSFNGLGIAQLAFGVLGVLVMTGEYSTGMIRTSLAAVPRRSRFLGAKAVVLAAAAAVVAEAIAFVTFLVGQAMISGRAPAASLGQPGVLRAVIGAGLYLTLIALLGLGLGTLLRHPAASIAVVVALLFVLPAIANALPSSWANPIEEYWPTNAGAQVLTVGHAEIHFSFQGHVMAPWTGFGVMCLFVAAVLGLGFLLLERRDA
jgi:ABC-2 type transport system permease protein